MSDSRLQRLRAVLDARQPDLRLFLEKVHKPHNLAAILRTCDAVGVQYVHAVVQESQVRRRDRSASGTQSWVNVVTHSDVAAGVEALHREGIRVYAAHLSEQAMDYREIDYTQPTAILLGAELEGVSETAASCVDAHLTIPMHGLGASLNVSVAAGVILYEAERQRRQAGFFEGPRLDKQAYQTLLFEWLYPRVAEACKRRGVAYPPLDNEGGILGSSVDLKKL
ncbi:MAG: tRNA (guanosine(18)-2'-O)-methyltransferase TrmH [Gammaproteobacteria bacterium]